MFVEIWWKFGGKLIDGKLLNPLMLLEFWCKFGGQLVENW